MRFSPSLGTGGIEDDENFSGDVNLEFRNQCRGCCNRDDLGVSDVKKTRIITGSTKPAVKPF